MSHMRTTLARVRGLGSAREGTEHFWRQRLTAVANIPLVLFLVGLVVALTGADHAAVRATIANPLVAIGLLLALVSVLSHMKAGMQIVIEDYVHSELAKVALLMLNQFFTIVVGAVSVFSVLLIALGG